MKYRTSKFVWDSRRMVLVTGKAPYRDDQLYKGEDTHGNKMELVSYDGELICYLGWS